MKKSLTKLVDELKDQIIPYETLHAKIRKEQRGIDNLSVQITLEYGDEYVKETGSFAYYFSKHTSKRIPKKLLKFENFDKYIGTTVIISAENTIITVYKNKHLKNLSKFLSKN